MLVLQLNSDDSAVYITQGPGEPPVGRIRFTGIRNGRILLEIEGDEREFGVYREKAMRKKMGAQGFERDGKAVGEKCRRPRGGPIVRGTSCHAGGCVVTVERQRGCLQRDGFGPEYRAGDHLADSSGGGRRG